MMMVVILQGWCSAALMSSHLHQQPLCCCLGCMSVSDAHDLTLRSSFHYGGQHTRKQHCAATKHRIHLSEKLFSACIGGLGRKGSRTGPVLIWGLSAGLEQTNGAQAEGDPAANDISQLGQNKVAQSVSWDNGGEHI